VGNNMNGTQALNLDMSDITCSSYNNIEAETNEICIVAKCVSEMLKSYEVERCTDCTYLQQKVLVSVSWILLLDSKC
jgi:hypothetical protein